MAVATPHPIVALTSRTSSRTTISSASSSPDRVGDRPVVTPPRCRLLTSSMRIGPSRKALTDLYTTDKAGGFVNNWLVRTRPIPGYEGNQPTVSWSG